MGRKSKSSVISETAEPLVISETKWGEPVLVPKSAVELGAMDPEYDAQEDIEIIEKAFGVPEEIEEAEAEKELEETTKNVMNFVEEKLKPKMKHKNCYCVMDGPDDIVLAFLPEALDNKARGKLFQIIGELGFSMEKTTTISASELFDRQKVEEPKEPEPEKTLFDKLEE